MKYIVRWDKWDGSGAEEDFGADLKGAVQYAERLNRKGEDVYGVVEVVDETGRVVWPFSPADADLDQTAADAAAETQTERDMDKNTIIQALEACAYRKCSDCPYRGNGIACKYRLMLDAANMLAATMTGKEERA